jgi:hypothetical protein
VIETIDRAVIERTVGSLSTADLQNVQASVRAILGL